MSPYDFFLAFMLGVSFAAPPGVVTAEAVRRGLERGFWGTAMVGAGSLIGDAAYAIVAFLGLLVFVNSFEYTTRIIGIVSSFILFWLAYTSIPQSRIDVVPLKTKRGAFLTGALLSLTNPWASAFWIGFGGSFLTTTNLNNNINSTLFLAVFLLGSAFWFLILSVLVAFLRRWITPILFRAVSWISAIVFAGFGFYTLFSVLL